MDGVVKQSFGINLTIMRAFGLYPPESKFSYKVQAYLLFSVFTLPVPILGSIYYIFNKNNDITQIDDGAFSVPEVACQITKFLPFIQNRKKIRKCINYFDSSFFATGRQNQKEILNKSIRICKRNTLVFLMIVIGGIIFYSTRTLFGEEKKLPVEVWLPWNVTSESQIFYLVYLFLVMGVAYSSIACAAVDPLIGGLACLAAHQLKILKDNLQNLSKYAEEEMIETKEVNKDKIIYRRIRHCINHHTSILTFVSEYEACFSSAVFGQLFGSIVVICFVCFVLSKIEPMSFNFFSMITFMTVFLIQIYVYCYYGTVLYEESNTLTNAIYMGNWYDYDVKTKKAVLILMERCKKPIVLRAGTIFDVSVETFATILRRSYSLLAVLKNQ